MGIQVKRDDDGIHLSQHQYLINLLASCGMTNLKPSSVPMVANQDLTTQEEPIADGKQFRRILGSLQYLTLTRPDIQFSVNKLAQFMSAPTPTHFTALKKVLRYLSGTHRMESESGRQSISRLRVTAMLIGGEICWTEKVRPGSSYTSVIRW